MPIPIGEKVFIWDQLNRNCEDWRNNYNQKETVRESMITSTLHNFDSGLSEITWKIEKAKKHWRKLITIQISWRRLFKTKHFGEYHYCFMFMCVPVGARLYTRVG